MLAFYVHTFEQVGIFSSKKIKNFRKYENRSRNYEKKNLVITRKLCCREDHLIPSYIPCCITKDRWHIYIAIDCAEDISLF